MEICVHRMVSFRQLSSELVLVNERTGKLVVTDFGLRYHSDIIVPNLGPTQVPGWYTSMSPEKRTSHPFATTMSDIWAVGMIGYEMCTGLSCQNPIPIIEQYHTTKLLDLNQIPQHFGTHVHTIIRQCLQWNAVDRPTARQLQGYIEATFPTLRNWGR
jgi:serine/threonine protein kinase